MVGDCPRSLCRPPLRTVRVRIGIARARHVECDLGGFFQSPPMREPRATNPKAPTTGVHSQRISNAPTHARQWRSCKAVAVQAEFASDPNRGNFKLDWPFTGSDGLIFRPPPIMRAVPGINRIQLKRLLRMTTPSRRRAGRSFPIGAIGRGGDCAQIRSKVI